MRNLFESFDCFYHTDGDRDFKTIWGKEYLKKMKTHFIDTIKELKYTRSWWEIELLVAVVVYSEYMKKMKRKALLIVFMKRQLCKKSLLKYFFIISLNHSWRSLVKQKNRWKETGLLWNLLLVYVSMGSPYIESTNCLRYKNTTIN